MFDGDWPQLLKWIEIVQLIRENNGRDLEDISSEALLNLGHRLNQRHIPWEQTAILREADRLSSLSRTRANTGNPVGSTQTRASVGNSYQNRTTSQATNSTPRQPAGAFTNSHQNSDHYCSLCGTRFTTPSNRRKHEKQACQKQMMKDVFPCPKCDKEWTRKCHRKAHLQKHLEDE